jgi:outer membrane receptor for ferrienterochelin and colicin
VGEGTTTTLDIIFVDTSAEMQTVNIKYTMKKDRMASVNIMVKNAIGVSTGMSADAIKQTPDKNTGEVLKRMSGATIQDNKYAIIRGLNDRYNNAMMNGSPLPSTEPERKTFAFDLIPSNMLDNIIILKSGTPDLPGDFAGGIIQLNTKDVPDTAFYQLAFSSSYNTLTTFKRMIDYKGGATDWTGFDNSRQLPGDFPSASDFTKFNTTQTIEEAKRFKNDYALTPHTADPNFGLQANLGN